MPPRILIVDDEDDIRFSLSGILEDEGMEVSDASTGEKALQLVNQFDYDLVFLDIWMPGIDGLKVLEKISRSFPELPVVMISGHGNIETAVSAIKKGAHDFIEKPLSLEKVILTARKAIEFSLLKKENRTLRTRIGKKVARISGHSDPVNRLKEMIGQVAPTDATVLITGENGTGKEIVARSVHAISKRANMPMIAVNCAAIPEELIESELFGHEKGAFTGADKNKKGKFEAAHCGTLFLDEIGDMSLKTQAKILRILQEQTLEKVGGHNTRQVDVRIIAATNKDLALEIAEGRFREDLYYRLRVFPLEVPPLRTRTEDIPEILKEFLQFMVNEHNFKPISFSPETIAHLQKYAWPGNVRELKNFVERLFILYPGQTITLEMLPAEYSASQSNSGSEQSAELNALLEHDYKSARLLFETWYLSTRLTQFDGNISKMAEAIGLERSYLHRKLKSVGS